MNTNETLAEHYLQDVRERMRGVKALGDGALAQLADAQLSEAQFAEAEWHTALTPESNSVAVIIQHLSGNMHSRWGAFRQGFSAGAEGESSTRNRDAEFEEGQQSPAELRQRWEDGWTVFLAALDHLQPADLLRELTIRAETHTVLQAIQRQVAHYSGHVYQLVYLVKALRGPEWQTLSIARGGSAAYNAGKMGSPT